MPNDLFFDADERCPLPIDGGQLYIIRQLPLPHTNADILAQLIKHTPWRSETITLWGKQHQQPRLSAWYGDIDAQYSYSGIHLTPLPWSSLLATIKAAVETATAHRFNSVLLNYYRDHRDSMGFHSDDEPELGPQPAIASLSFGAARHFSLKHQSDKRIPTRKLLLEDGNLLLMAGDMQKNWLHGINKQTQACGARINLTFRQIYPR